MRAIGVACWSRRNEFDVVDPCVPIDAAYGSSSSNLSPSSHAAADLCGTPGCPRAIVVEPAAALTTRL